MSTALDIPVTGRVYSVVVPFAQLVYHEVQRILSKPRLLLGVTGKEGIQGIGNTLDSDLVINRDLLHLAYCAISRRHIALLSYTPLLYLPGEE